jgi:hypothetical protein
MIFIVEIYYKKHGATAVSQIGYRTLQGAIDFIKSRSDYVDQPITNWTVETRDHIYIIKDIQIWD